MKKVRITARKDTVSPSGHFLDDEGLKCLDNYIEKFIVVDDDARLDVIGDEFIAEYDLGSEWNVVVEKVKE
ncbi:MAG: hypothetical protein IJ872_03960 [Eubacterium sp.]|nr:hypothetical protein [Eubacterium sp.]